MSRCKLSPDGTLSPLHPHQLRTTFLGLFVCNAIALGPIISVHLLHAGTPLGKTVQLLTHAIAHRGIPHAAIVLADPEQALPATTDSHLPTVALPQNPLPALPVITSSGLPVPALFTPGQALLATPDAAARAEDAHAPAQRLLDQLNIWLSRLTKAHLV